MLSKSDLAAISQLIKSRIEPFRKETHIEFEDIKSRIKRLEAKTNKIAKDVKSTINFFDNFNLKLEKKVQATEDHLHFPRN